MRGLEVVLIYVFAWVVAGIESHVPSYSEPKSYQTEQQPPAVAPVHQYNAAVQQPSYYPVSTTLSFAFFFCFFWSFMSNIVLN